MSVLATRPRPLVCLSGWTLGLGCDRLQTAPKHTQGRPGEWKGVWTERTNQHVPCVNRKKKKKEREKWLHVGIEASCVNFPRTCVRSACNSIYTARPIAINYCCGKKKSTPPPKKKEPRNLLLLWKEFGKKM